MACVISHKYQFIFIHVPKTGGTSFMSPFSPYWKLLARDDIKIRGHHRANRLARQYPDEWKKYFKFAFVRNPWDRAVSLWLTHDSKHENNLEGFLDRIRDNFYSLVSVLPQFVWVSDDMDYVGQYENYARETAWIIGKLGLPLLPLKHLRKTERNPDYRKYYDIKALTLANDIYRKDIERFGYIF